MKINKPEKKYTITINNNGYAYLLFRKDDKQSNIYLGRNEDQIVKKIENLSLDETEIQKIKALFFEKIKPYFLNFKLEKANKNIVENCKLAIVNLPKNDKKMLNFYQKIIEKLEKEK